MMFENTYLLCNSISNQWVIWQLKRLTTGKNEKVHSLHVPAIKFIGKKQLV